MCGIAGIVHHNGESASHPQLKRMTDAVSHRGPDGEGHYIDRNIGLGHRRLAIIDLSTAGKQPMSSPDGNYVLTYNGEIYNFQELRARLQSLGYRFFSKTDSEVVLNALIEWGERALEMFNGMFAFAFWDKTKQQMLLARDRYGIKPLYYQNSENLFLFGSEVKAILAHKNSCINVDYEGMLEYFTFQNFFTNKTIYKNVSLLDAGSYMKVKTDGSNSTTIHHYWDYAFVESGEIKDEREYLEELDRLFKQAVTRQLIADVDIGAYLSGGMDSGSITAIAASEFPNIKSFTCGFDVSSASGVEINFDERTAAEKLSYQYQTEHYEMVLKAGDMERAIPRLAWHLEEPRVGQSYPNFYAAQLASKFVKVVLSGAGGDELFGGYPWRYYRAVVNDDFEHYIDKYYLYWQRLIPNRIIKEVFKPVWAEVEHVWTRDVFRDVFDTHMENLTRPEDYINHSLYFEAKTFLHGLLVVEDKLSMAHSLETRVPFLDNDLVDFAMQVPVNMKLGNLANVVELNENEPGAKTARYFQKTNDGKLLLRKMLSKYVPSEVVDREKQGFSAPDASWFKGESIEYVKKTLMNGDAAIYEFMDADTIKLLINEHLEGKQNRRLLIWSLLNMEQCCKSYFQIH